MTSISGTLTGTGPEIIEKFEPGTRITRGLAYGNLGRHQQAVQDFDQAIRLNPQDANAYGTRAMAYSFLGKDEEARQDVERAVQLGYDRAALEERIEELKKQR